MSSICFAIDGAKVSAPQHLPPSTRLVEFIRDHARNKSVKVGCGEGGCGACSVLVTRLDTDTGETSTSVVNSCLATIASVDGCAITTSSGLGSSKKGFHRVQEAIAASHGSQCGFCTPGISVACAAALQRCSAAGVQPTAEVLVSGLDGNLCRCTGWRPIVDACKDLADIEDSAGAGAGCGQGQQAPVMPQWLRDYASRQRAARGGEVTTGAPLRVLGCSGGQQWADPASLEELLALMAQWRGQGFRLVAGNTGAGVYHDWPHEAALISVAHVAEMREAGWREGGLQLGGATTLAEAIQLLRAPEAPAAAAQQLGALAQHLEQVAGHPVRNAATLGGHLALLKARPFQSDVATLLVAGGAQLCLSSAQGHVWMSVTQLLAPATSVDWQQCVVSCLHLPTPPPCSWLWSARVALRRSNAHALVNLALLLQLEEEGVEEVGAGAAAAEQQQAGSLTGRVVRSARIAYGGETASGGWCCGRAQHAEQVVAQGRPLTAAALISALEALSAELGPQQRSGYASEALQGLLLQALAPLVDCAQLSLQQPELARLIAGAVPLPPPGLPEGRREVPDFSDPASAPVGAPVAKDGVLLQASGEALYSSDASAAGMLYAAVVLSPTALARLDGVDASQALALPGVLACLTAEDIPSGPDTQVLGCDLLAWQQVLYVGQPLAVVLAESQALAERGAQLVQVHVSRPLELGQPIITIADAIAAGSYWDVPDLQQASGGRDDSSGSISAPSASKASWGEAMAGRPGTGAPLSGGIYLQRQGQQQGGGPGQARLVQAVVRQAGDMHAAMAGSTYRLEAQRYSLPSQQHMFMETQAAMAEPLEGGGMRVTAGSQSLDAVQLAVAQVLQLPHHQVTAITGRVGGAFGGKASRAPPVAALAAVAAHASGRPVSLVFPRDVDLATTCGRSAAELLYDVGYEPDGTINAIDMKAWFQGGAFLDLGWGDVLGLAQGVDVAYDLEALRLEARYCRCHLPPRTIMRAPGMVQAAMVMEQVMEVVARQLRLDPWLVKQRNFLPLPEGPDQAPSRHAGNCTAAPAASDDADVQAVQEDAASTSGVGLLDLSAIAGALPLPTEQTAAAAANLSRRDDEPACSITPAAGQGAAVLDSCSTRQEVGGHPRSCDTRLLQLLYGAKASSSTAGSGPGSKAVPSNSCHIGSSSSSAARRHVGGSTCGAAASVVRTSLGRTLLAEQYTLPRIWRQLADSCQYTQRQQAIAAFNASSPWVKRGMAITPSRFDCAPTPMSAAVSVYADGSVLVSHGGVEMGQGLATKVKQVAVHALSQLLPPEQRPLPLELVKVAASSSDVVPNGGPTWSSTGSDSACEAVRRACGQVTRTLQPHLQLAEDGAHTWAATVAAVHPAPGLTPANAMLSAYGFFDGAASDGQQMQYNTFGAACCEAEVDLLTGARHVLRVDMLVDCGRSINPAVDMGQLEGGFVQGLGMMVCEEVVLHEGTGQLLTGSTWQYKIPTPDMLPAQFNVTLLPDSPNTRGVLGSKASGEPGVMLSAVVASALQAAAAAAMDDPAMSAGSGEAGSAVLATPATPALVLRTRLLCCGALLSVLRAAERLL